MGNENANSTEERFENVAKSMLIHEHDCSNTIAHIWGKDAKPYSKQHVVTRLHLHVTRKDPMPWEDGTDYADYYYIDLPYEVKVEPGRAAWTIFENAVMEAMEIVHDAEMGPEIVNQHASLEQCLQANWYCEDLAEIEKEQRILGNNSGPDAVKEYDWFCVAVEGESCHHGNGWHSGCAECDQEENEVK